MESDVHAAACGVCGVCGVCGMRGQELLNEGMGGSRDIIMYVCSCHDYLVEVGMFSKYLQLYLFLCSTHDCYEHVVY